MLDSAFQVGQLAYVILSGTASWIHKHPPQRLKCLSWQQSKELRHLPVLARVCSSFPALGRVACGALLFLLLGIGFMSPCASQSLRLWGCFRNKSSYHPIAVVLNYPLLDGDVWKHKQEGFQPFSQCLNVWTTLRASCSAPLPCFQHLPVFLPGQHCSLLNALSWWWWGPKMTLTREGDCEAGGNSMCLLSATFLKKVGGANGCDVPPQVYRNFQLSDSH